MRAMKDSGIPWIGKIPEGWKTIRFKYLHNGLNTGEAIDKEFWSKDDNGRTFYTAGLVPIKTNYTDFPDWKYTKNTDLLLARNGTPYVYLPSENACYTDHIIRASMKEQINRKFVQYSLQQSILSVIVDSVSIATWSASLWDEQTIAWPSPEEQKGIVDYLDAECARIDVVLEQTRASIEEYKKLKQSVITQAVTKGIRPNRPMKDSGIDWIGQIPAEWEHRKLKSFISMPVIDGPHESPELFDTGIPYISATAIENGKINFALMRGFISEQYCDECDKRYKPIRNDILVIKLGASTGQVAIVETDDRFNIWVPLAAVRCNKRVIPQYIYFCFQSEYLLRQMELSWTFGTQQTLGVKTIEQLKFFIPCLDEQKEITDYLDEKCKKIDSLISKKEQFLSEMESYKKSLIFEYVTGKKEVS